MLNFFKKKHLPDDENNVSFSIDDIVEYTFCQHFMEEKIADLLKVQSPTKYRIIGAILNYGIIVKYRITGIDAYSKVATVEPIDFRLIDSRRGELIYYYSVHWCVTYSKEQLQVATSHYTKELKKLFSINDKKTFSQLKLVDTRRTSASDVINSMISVDEWYMIANSVEKTYGLKSDLMAKITSLINEIDP